MTTYAVAEIVVERQRLNIAEKHCVLYKSVPPQSSVPEGWL
ncbi:MAG: hypothetical protein R3E36_12810 [Nitrosomonas sp.]